MRVRQYSISSSPLKDAESCTITFSILDRPSLSDPQIEFEGVASTYLSTLQAGDSIQVSIRPTSKKTFRIPADASTPLLMFAAGTGIAPFRGFVEQRAIQLAANPERKFAPALLIVGCRSQSRDRLFAEEIDEWAKLGAVEVLYAFSREKEQSAGCSYVGERMLKEKEKVSSMWDGGARAYVCGSRVFAKGIRDAMAEILRGSGERVEEQVEDWFEAMQERIASDVFD